MTSAVAPGKIILVGEHAVVYGRPAIALPVWERRARAEISEALTGSGCTIVAHDINEIVPLRNAPDDHPLALVVRLSLAELDLPPDPDWRIDLRSDIPIAGGLGSGAAVSTAIARAIYAHAGHDADPATLCALVYQSERLFHGTPSGIDNTVIAYGQPLWYKKGEMPAFFTPRRDVVIVIADSGIPSPTKESVGDVHRAWQSEPEQYEALFDQIGEVAKKARRAIESGDLDLLGTLFNQNQELLRALEVSSPELEMLIKTALDAGAAGAKLSGGGRGGNMIAVVGQRNDPEDDGQVASKVASALINAGAKRAIITTIRGSGDKNR